MLKELRKVDQLSGRTIFLPLEIFAREYLGKLALAVKLAEHEREVVIGYNHLVRTLALECKQPAVFYEIKGKSQKDMGHLAKLRQKGICLVGQDEEAGISYVNFQDFEVLRPEVNGLKPFESFFAWGKDDLEAYSRTQDTNSILQTGSPRTAFWGTNGAEFYEDQIKSLRNTHGNYVLVVSNLGSRNNIWSPKEMKKYARNSGYGKSYERAAENRIHWEAFAFEATLKLMTAIQESTNLNILFRPHPSEDLQVWRELFANSPNVKVSKSGDSIPHILAAAHVVHAGSTVGLESLLCGTSTISFQNLIGQTDVPMTSNLYSKKIDTIPELIKCLQSNVKMGPEQGFAEMIDSKLTKVNDFSVLDEQAKAIHNLRFNSRIKVLPEDSSLVNLIHKNRIFQRLRYGKSSYAEVHKNKRPVIQKEKIVSDIEKLLNQFGTNYELETKVLGESTFSLKRRA